jgi:PKD repeat protein
MRKIVFILIITLNFFNSIGQVEDHMNITVSGNGFMDQTDINFMPEATPGFDFYDANKWQSANGQPTLFTSVGEEMLAINSNPSLTNTVAIPMGLMPGADGTFTFTFNDIASFPLSAMITLEDLFTNTITDLRQTNTYTFSSLETDSTDRFIIHFQPGVTASVVDQDCENATGSITYTQNGTTVWSLYDVKDNSNNTYAQGSNFTGTITVNNLLPQEYILNLTHSSGYTAQEFITVNSHGVPVTVGLTASDTTITMGDMVTLTATATNATGYNWNFGDGNSIVGSTSQQHTYALPGNYTAIITASNDSCSKADSVIIHVADTTTGINNHTASTLTIYGQGERVVVQFNNWGGNKADIFMYNTLGQRVESLTGVSTIKGRQELNVAGIKPGYYLIQVVSDGKIQSQKIYLGNY